ncbi:MAG: AAA family ATPase, partial [Actinomycetota bacterium]
MSRGFAGRREELAELATGVASADRGVGRTFLVNGEPGIGKTRFCEEVATRASSDGARVLWGRCWEGAGAPVYWPWIQIMRPLLRSPDRDRLLGAVEPERAYLEQILPEVARNNIGVNVEVVESDRGRFYVFDAVATLLATASEERTLVLILDDLHHADRPTLMLLDFIAANLRDARVVTLGTYRPADVQLDPDRGHILASAARRSRVIPLSGLTPSEVTELIDATEGIDLPSETISALVALSEGNPFFLDEFVRLVVSEGTDLSDIAVPHGVREIIRQRVRPLSVATRQLLDIAAVIGRESTLAVLERVADLPRDSTRDGLWAAERSGIIDEAGLAPGVYRFVHALIRETLYEDLPPSERAQIHLRVARALEDLYPHDVDQRVIEIAHHYFRALEGGIGEAASRAIEHLTAAGGSSMERFAWEEAAHHFGEALTALDLASDDPSARIELLLKRGEALKRGADLKGSLDAFAAAAEVARALDDPGPSLARAAIGFEDARWADINLWRMPEAIMLLREALGSLGPDDKASRSAVLA